MKNYKQLFHLVSYLQYPLIAVAIYFVFLPILKGPELLWDSYNKMLVFMGLAISFSTLQDSRKTQNNFSLRIYQNRTYSKIFIFFLVAFILSLVLTGMYGLFGTANERIKELSLGVIVLGMGMIGMLKLVLEMVENHGPKGERHSGFN